MRVTQEMLEVAIKKAVEVGLLPVKFSSSESYQNAWDGMRIVLQSAIDCVQPDCKTIIH